jgi:hypothetical protein
VKSEADRGFLLLARTCEWIGIILTFTTPFLVLGLVRDELTAPGAGWWIVPGCLVGYVLSDWLSGMVHWAGDRWGNEHTFMLGPTIVKPFRLHHSDQKDITRHGFVQTNANNCMGTTVLLVFSLLLPDSGMVGMFLRVVAVSMSLGLVGTNQFHKWAHLDDPPAPIRLLQRLHLILPPDHHRIHHTAPYDRYYCITTGWLNPLLFRLGYFAFLERSLERLTGAAAYRDPNDYGAADPMGDARRALAAE